MKATARPAGQAQPTRRPPVQRERALQAAIVQFHAQVVEDPLSAILFAVPNGEKRDKVTAGILTGPSKDMFLSAVQLPRRVRSDACCCCRVGEPWEPEDLTPVNYERDVMRPAGQGVLSGANDLFLLLPGAVVVPIEVKVPAGPDNDAGGQSKAQRIFERACRRLGHEHRVITSVEEYQALLLEFGVKLKRVQLFPVALKPAQLPAGLAALLAPKRKRRRA